MRPHASTLEARNPLRAGTRVGQSPDPVSIVIFGATGDLTARKLVPALFSLLRENHLPATYNIIGFARRDWGDNGFKEQMQQGVGAHGRYKPNDTQIWDGFARNLFYVQGSFDDHRAYQALDVRLQALAQERGMPDNRLYYLSAPPQTYPDIIKGLGNAGMTTNTEDGWRRIVIEKPFGYDLDTAIDLNEVVHRVFAESQVYRIDHYLGKETVQNILVLRFANAIFEPLWNREYVDHVQISVAESVGVEGRAGYYDTSGVVRDIVQNHILQLLTLIAMEPPVAFEADAIRDEKVKVLRSVRPITSAQLATQTVRAQYGSGTIDGTSVPGYLNEENVPESSTTPTFTAIEWYIDNWRWTDVPFYMRSGKRMTRRATEISIHFKRPPHLLFDSSDDEVLRANVLVIRIQPDEGISLRFEAKLPGAGIVRRSVTMDFGYGTSFGITDPPEAYERLLLDAVLGDATLFARSDEIEWAWKLVDPIIQGWRADDGPLLEVYESGTWGPEGAENLLGRSGRHWRRL